MRKSIHVPYKSISQTLAIKEVADVLASLPPCGEIDCVNWSERFPAHPRTTLRLVHTGDMLWVRFDVEGRGLRAMHTADLEHVNEDSCVEFFVTNAQGTRYFNFEFNCMGVCNASHRISKAEDVHRLAPEELQSVVRWSSLTGGGEGEPAPVMPFDKRDGNYTWSLTVGIPLPMLGVTREMLDVTLEMPGATRENVSDIPRDMPRHAVALRGNFYKCGDLTAEPHYLSWSPIAFERPNFHLPEFFGELLLAPATMIPNKDYISA